MNQRSEPVEESLFQEAADIHSWAAREAFLDRACGRDTELRARLDLLLEGHFSGQGFLTEMPERLPRAQAGTEIRGRYTLVRRIGEGGFGEVWEARQHAPVKRHVAIKVLKPGMDTRQVVARFEAERQALALMDHPCIAKVFDAGETEEGRPYFAMELVLGTQITEYCRQRRLSTADRLRLVVQVCRAIQHAHQKGIIHRDIKPSNILVTSPDIAEGSELGTPTVIDFGIAKATRQELTDKTVVTQFQQFLGTPAYISPEQALVTSDDIDTRSDIYSLGVLLYELLVGTPPFDSRELLTAGLDEMRRIIREKEPVRPSQRQTTAAIDPDLDWIVMKCLEKDRGRRYETANGLAMDLQRFLDHEPIVARPPSALYRVSKVVRRNPMVATLTALLVLAGVFALVIATVMHLRLVRAKSETDRANQQLAKNVLFLESEKMEERSEEGWRAQPMAWLAYRLRGNPNDRAAAARLLSMLNHRSFALPIFAPLQHGGKVHSVWFSPDEKEIMTSAEDGTVCFWDTHDGRALRVITNATSIASAGYRAGGKRLLVVSRDAVARVYDARMQHLLFQVPNVRNPAELCAEGGDGRWLFVEHLNRTISRWDLETGAQLEPLIEFPTAIKMADYSDTASALAVVCADQSVHVCHQATGEFLATSRLLDHPPTGLRFTPDGKRIFIGTGDPGKMAVWDYQHDREITEVQGPVPLRIERWQFTPDGRRMLTWTWDSHLQLCDTETLRPIGKSVNCGVNPGFVVSHSGRLAASIGHSGNSFLIDLERVHVPLEPMQHDGTVYSATFDAADSRLLTGSVDGAARLWDIRMRNPVRPLPPASTGGGTATLNHQGDRFVVSIDASGLQLCDLKTARPLGPVLRHSNGGRADEGLRDAWFSPDDRSLLTVGVHGTLRIWDVATCQPRLDMAVGHDLNVAKFSPDGCFVVAGDRDGNATVWDAASGKRLAQTPHNGNEVLNVAFHPHSRVFITSAVDGMARSWTLPEGQPALPPLKHRGTIWSASFSPDGERIVTASSDKTAQIWDSRTGLALHHPLRHTKEVFLALFSPNGQRVLTTSDDGTARLWNVQNGEPVSPLLRHRAGIWLGAFSPDGSIIATASSDRTVRLWDPETALPISEPLLHQGPLGQLSFSPDGRTLLTFGGQPMLWDVVQPPIPIPTWFCDLIEGLAGYRQAAGGQFTPTTPDAIASVRTRVTGSTPIDFYSRWAKWFLNDRMHDSVPAFQAE